MINFAAGQKFWNYHYWSKVKKQGKKKHWLWTGRILSQKLPYGVICNREVDDRPRLAHHISWELSHNAPLKRNERLVNTCGVTACVNPLHWKLGSAGHTAGDTEATRARNEQIYKDRFTDGMSLQAIGEKHKISRQRVDQILQKLTKTAKAG